MVFGEKGEIEEMCKELREKTWKYNRLKMLIYLFWWFNTLTDSTDRKLFQEKTFFEVNNVSPLPLHFDILSEKSPNLWGRTYGGFVKTVFCLRRRIF